MAIYRFRVRFEDYDEVVRDIEIRARQTFQELHDILNEAVGFDGKLPSSFFLSDENWKKGKEFTNKHEKNGKALSLQDSKLTAFINDPHQKIYCIMEADPEWNFQIELIKITNEEPHSVYPRCVRSVGTAPKQYGVSKLEEIKDSAFLEEVKYEEPLAEDGEEPLMPEDAEIPITGVIDETDAELASGDELGFGDDVISHDPDRDA